jgi:hypothetical protein
MRRLSGTPSLRSAITVWISTAHSVAPMTLGNSARMPFAGGIDDSPTVPADQRQDHALMGLEVPHGGGLIRVHEPAVANDIGGKNGREPTLNRGLFVHDAFSALAPASRS